MRVALFITCLNDLFLPRAGIGMVKILEHLGVEVVFPEGQTCCGQAQWNSGYEPEAAALARHFLDVFGGSIAGVGSKARHAAAPTADYIVSPAGSCTGMVRHTYPQIFRDNPARRSASLALGERTFEFTEFLVNVLGVTDLGARFPARVAYHQSCHMSRWLGVTEPPLRLLQAVRDLELLPLTHPELCCGFGGTFAVKSPELSVAMADDKLADAEDTGAEILVSADPSCLLHLAGRAQRRRLPLRTMHIAELLAEGVGLL